MAQIKTAFLKDETFSHQPPRDYADGIHATPGRAGAASVTAPDPLSWGAGTECDAAKGGGAGPDRDRSSARRRSRPPAGREREGAHALGAVVEARVRCRYRAVPVLWRAAQAHRGHRRTCRDPAHPRPSWAGRAATPARTGRAGRSIAGGLRGKSGLGWDLGPGRRRRSARARVIAPMGWNSGAMDAEVVCDAEKAAGFQLMGARLTARTPSDTFRNREKWRLKFLCPNDFRRFVDDDEGRLRYWQRAMAESARLRDEFAALVQSGRIAHEVRPT